MNADTIIECLQQRRRKLDAENHKHDGAVRLCRTKWYHDQRNTVSNYKKMEAIDAAIMILRGESFTLQYLDRLYINCFPECDKCSKIEYGLRSVTPEPDVFFGIVENCIRKYLPVYKKEVLKRPFYIKWGDTSIDFNKNSADKVKAVTRIADLPESTSDSHIK